MVVVHMCCAPCATTAVERLRQDDLPIHGFFYNPNIEPEEEYHRRLAALDKLADDWDFAVEHGEYDAGNWFRQTRAHAADPEGGARCELCFRIRLQKTAEFAHDRGAECFTTTLTLSPWKNAAKIFEIGEHIASETGVRFLAVDYKKRAGFQRSVELSRSLGIYRQNYCGCIYSRSSKGRPDQAKE